jgi:hypothetical protein
MPATKIHPMLLALQNAPVTDEPETEGELLAVEASKASLRAGEPTYTLQELASAWGVTL